MTTSPKIRSDIGEQKVGDELMLFDPRTDQVHVLNATSAYIWSCLKDGHDAAQIEARVREAFDTASVGDLTELVLRALAQFAGKNLLETPGPAA